MSKLLKDVTELTYKYDLTRCVRIGFNEYDSVKDALKRKEEFYEGMDEHGEACTICLTGCISVYQRTHESRVADIDESILIERLNKDVTL
jgi:hypothetical protein